MKNGNDKLLKEKIESLNTLSSGIVFGKEEAWDKLQARMDKPATKRIPLKYRMAAAAMLLLYVSVITIYYAPVKQVAKISTPKKIKEPVNIAAAPLANPEVIPIQKTTTTIEKENKHKPNTPKSEKQIVQTTITNIQPETPLNETQLNNDVVAVNNASLVPPVKKPMKVVHISEISDDDVRMYASEVANNSPVLNLKKLPVVHINDVASEEYEVQKIMKENRIVFGRQFPSQESYNGPDNTGDNHNRQFSNNIIEIRLNTQN